MPSFDIVSQVDSHELTNAVDQAARELKNRYDLRGTDARFELGRTHLDFALLRRLQDDNEAAARHLATAHSHFSALRTPKYITRVQDTAAEMGVLLAGASLRGVAAERLKGA